MPKVPVKIHEFNKEAHEARLPLPVLDEIEIDESPIASVDERMAEAKRLVMAHTLRSVRTISHLKGGGYAAIVSPKG